MDHLIVLHKEYPYSNCTEKYSKFKCLNNCFKEKNRLSKYFYQGNENTKINLSQVTDESTKEDEKKCFYRCSKDSCKSTFFIGQIEAGLPKTKLFKAYPLTSSFDCWAQLIGIICLFVNISFYQIHKKFYELVIYKIKRKRLVIYIKYSNLIIILICTLLMFTKVILDYKYKRDFPAKKEIIYKLVESESITLIICVSVDRIIKKDYEKQKVDPFEMEFYKMKLIEMEEKTNAGFHDIFSDIYLEFQNRQKIDWQLLTGVYFKGSYFPYPLRCFPIQIKNVPKYQNLLSVSKLIIEMKHRFYELYLLPEKESFDSKTFKFINQIFIRKMRIKSTNCTHYSEKTHNCTGRFNCIDRCINRNFSENTNSISPRSFVDKRFFSQEEWSNLVFNNSNAFDSIERDCKQFFSVADCNENYFDKGYNVDLASYYGKIDLNYEIIRLEEYEPSIYKLLLDMLNIQSILYGLNVFKLFITMFCFLKIKFKPKETKLYLYIIYLCCITGSSYHTYYVFDKILGDELDYSQFYKISKSFEMPEIIFCFEIDQKNKIGINHKLNVNYLEKATGDMRIDKVFDKIDYLNRFYEWISLNSSNLTTNEFRIETFYFFNSKCFSIKQEIEYNEREFYFKDSNDVLRIDFNKQFIRKNRALFLTKIKGRKQFSRVLDLEFYKMKYTIKQELLEIIHNDMLSSIRNPLSFIYGENGLSDVDKYIGNLMNNSKKLLNMNTLILPLEIKKNSNNLEIHDELFEQFYMQIQNISDQQSPSNQNYQKLFATNYQDLHYGGNDFIFSFTFFRKKLIITNGENFNKLVLNLLNVLSIWLNLSILDLYVYIYKIKIVFVFSYKLLLKLQKTLLSIKTQL